MLRSGRQFRVVLRKAGFFALVLCSLALFSCQPEAHSNAPPSKTSDPPAVSQPELNLKCPDGSAHASLKPGHHTVVLSWNASKPSKDLEVKGYCIYRSEARIEATRLKRCKKCQRINEVPVTGTACIDDQVRDEHSYYYVVTAIGVENDVSAFSNSVNITATQKAVHPGPPISAPLCRAWPK